MKKNAYVSLLGMSLLLSCIAYPVIQKNLSKLSQKVKNFKSKMVSYVKNSLPKTEKERAELIIGEGLVQGVFWLNGLNALIEVKRDKAQNFIDKNPDMRIRDWMTNNTNEANQNEMQQTIMDAVAQILQKTRMEAQVEVHYAENIRGGGKAYGQHHMFIPVDYAETEQDLEELKFLIAHEIGHIKNKDLLKIAVAYMAAPVVAFVLTHALNKATDMMIDQLIKALKLSEGSIGYNILTTFKSGKRRVMRSPIFRFLVAGAMLIAYNRYREKQADIFAAEHGYARGGIHMMEREWMKPDLFHPSPTQRKKYLEPYLED